MHPSSRSSRKVWYWLVCEAYIFIYLPSTRDGTGESGQQINSEQHLCAVEVHYAFPWASRFHVFPSVRGGFL